MLLFWSVIKKGLFSFVKGKTNLKCQRSKYNRDYFTKHAPTHLNQHLKVNYLKCSTYESWFELFASKIMWQMELLVLSKINNFGGSI